MTEKPQYTGKMLDELFAKVDDALEARSDSARTGENGRQLCSPSTRCRKTHSDAGSIRT